jgi:hypothetical protein
MRGTIEEAQKQTCYIISLHAVCSTLCVVISINMCCNPNLFYVPYFKFLCNYFLKFIIHKINSEMVKSGMVMLTGREKVDVASHATGHESMLELLVNPYQLVDLSIKTDRYSRFITNLVRLSFIGDWFSI